MADYSFAAPGGWKVTRLATAVEATPGKGVELVSVTRFLLSHPYRASLWPKVVPQLDHVIAQLAAQEHGSVKVSQTASIAGVQGRRYRLTYPYGGRTLEQQLGFVLRQRTEYQLLCRLAPEKSSSPACDLLFASFTLP